MPKIKIVLHYDGSRYSGWQIQKNTEQTIQQKVENALTDLNKSMVKITGAGRTDAGVHALGQAASFYLDVPIPVERIPQALNRLLPDDIICVEAEVVNDEFHARYDAVKKKYRYRILNKPYNCVFRRNYVYHYIQKLDIKEMKSAAEYFRGTHDFKAFQSSGSSISDTIRTIEFVSVYEKNEEIIIDVEGNGFLYNMVRIIAGTLIEVGNGKKNSGDISLIIKSCDREKAGFTAPASGLTLYKVYY